MEYKLKGGNTLSNDYKLNELDLNYLKDLDKKLNEIQAAATTYGTYQSNQELLSIVDHLCRVAGMVTSLQIQKLEKGYVETYRPQGYIDGKLSIAYNGMMRYNKKTREV
jgi:hypothetical protein